MCEEAMQTALHSCPLSHRPSLVLCLEKGHRTTAYPSWEGLLVTQEGEEALTGEWPGQCHCASQ